MPAARWSRRAALAALAALPLATVVRAAPMLNAADFGVVPDSLGDQTAELQAALDAARDSGSTLFLPGGQIVAQNLDFPGHVRVVGVPGSTALMSIGPGPVGSATAAIDLAIDGVTFAGAPVPGGRERGLLELDGCHSVRLADCTFFSAPSNGLVISNAIVTVEDCDFDDIADTAIFSRNGRGVVVSSCRIRRCGNAGIRIWRDEPGMDGTRLLGNAISEIRADGGGNGQNGNGINVFRAGGVIAADNRIDACAFTAIRLNATNDTVVRGNLCTRSGEVAIFSEFAFSGSVIADNIVDGAAGGISMTNFDSGGRLAACTGNIVRNIAPRSEVNPDTTPFGIFAEADAVIANNVVEAVPGLGIGAGWGPYLRDVVVDGNIVRDTAIGIGVSVAEGAGRAVVTGNLVSGASRAAIAGLAWQDTVTDDLVRDAGQFPSVTLSGNSAG